MGTEVTRTTCVRRTERIEPGASSELTKISERGRVPQVTRLIRKTRMLSFSSGRITPYVWMWQVGSERIVGKPSLTGSWN